MTNVPLQNFAGKKTTQNLVGIHKSILFVLFLVLYIVGKNPKKVKKTPFLKNAEINRPF